MTRRVGKNGPAAALDGGPEHATTMEDVDDSISRNRAYWEADAIRWADAGRRGWAQVEPNWGI